MKEGKITLTMKQLKRYQVICSYIDKQITRREAAELLSLSERRITGLKKGVVESGAEFLIHIPSKTEIQVLVNSNFDIRVKYRDNIFKTVKYVKPAGKKKSPPAKKKLENAVIPHLVHSSDNWKKIWWYEDYNQSLKFLNDLFFCDKKFIY